MHSIVYFFAAETQLRCHALYQSQQLFTAVCAGGSLLPYMLDESNNWGLSVDSIKAATKKARAEGKCVRGLVFINPGNPTGVRVCANGSVGSAGEMLLGDKLACFKVLTA
jgi:hypothetical protein